MPTTSNIEEKLLSETSKGYTDLSKWLIALSTGTIVFCVNLIKPCTAPEWKSILIFGIGLLVISILIGVRYVRLRIDGSLYNYKQLKLKNAIDRYSQNNPDSVAMLNGKNAKIRDIIIELNFALEKTEKKMDTTNSELKPLFYWQQWLFYAGIISVTIFGVFGI